MTPFQRCMIGSLVGMVLAGVIGALDADWRLLLLAPVIFGAVSAVKWEDTWSSEGNVMTDTELSALANNAVSAASPAYDNAAAGKFDQYALFELNVDFVSAPSAGAYVNVYAIMAPDGTNYGTTSTVAADVGQMRLVCSIFLPAITAAFRVHSPICLLPPGLMKFVLENKSGQAFPTSASSTLKLFTTSDESQ